MVRSPSFGGHNTYIETTNRKQTMINRYYLTHADIVASHVSSDGESCSFTFHWSDGHEKTIHGEYCVDYDIDKESFDCFALIIDGGETAVDVALYVDMPYVVCADVLKKCCEIVKEKYVE